MNKSKSNISSLLEMVKTVNSDLLAAETPEISMAESKELFDEFVFLHENIYNHKNFSLNTNDRLENILQILSDMANMDFSGIAEVKENFDHLDYFAFGLNHTSDRIREQVRYLSRFKNIFDSFSNNYFVTNEDGEIVYHNGNLKAQFGIINDLKGTHIREFFNLFQIKSRYSLDFLNSCDKLGISQGYSDNLASDTVIRVSSKPYFDEQKIKLGDCYKLELMDKSLYRSKIASKPQLVNSVYKFDEPKNNSEKKEQLLDIAQQFSDKTELNFREILILNSVNNQLNLLD